MGLSLREIVAVFEWLGVDRSHGAIWNWTHTLSEAQADPPTAEPSRVTVDEKQIEVDGEKKWLYAAIDTDSKLLLEIDVFSRRGTDSAAAFFHRADRSATTVYYSWSCHQHRTVDLITNKEPSLSTPIQRTARQ
jgi:transposase-like protein